MPIASHAWSSTSSKVRPRRVTFSGWNLWATSYRCNPSTRPVQAVRGAVAAQLPARTAARFPGSTGRIGCYFAVGRYVPRSLTQCKHQTTGVRLTSTRSPIRRRCRGIVRPRPRNGLRALRPLPSNRSGRLPTCVATSSQARACSAPSASDWGGSAMACRMSSRKSSKSEILTSQTSVSVASSGS